MIKLLGWILIIPSAVYLGLQGALFIDWLVVRDSTMSWNITLLVTFFILAVIGEGLREYGKHRDIPREVNNAKKH
jgi:hypothetical protein